MAAMSDEQRRQYYRERYRARRIAKLAATGQSPRGPGRPPKFEDLKQAEEYRKRRAQVRQLRYYARMLDVQLPADLLSALAVDNSSSDVPVDGGH